jgi:predicted nucleic acid-binding protein
VTIVDTGPIVALINPRDQHHQWARTAIRQINEPMLTCDAVLSEAFFLVSGVPNGIRRFTEMLASGAIQSDFATAANVRELASLIQTYQSLPISFADACLVRLAELHDGATILTADSHFHVYRKNGSNPLSLMIPGQL